MSDLIGNTRDWFSRITAHVKHFCSNHIYYRHVPLISMAFENSRKSMKDGNSMNELILYVHCLTIKNTTLVQKAMANHKLS